MVQSRQANIKSLTFIHTALTMGQLLFAGLTFYLTSTRTITPDLALNEAFKFVVPGIVIIGIISSNGLFKTLIKSAKGKQNLSEKMAAYQTASIIRWAMLEGPSLFAIVCYLLTGNYKFLLMAGAVIAVFIMNKPSKDKLVQDLELNQSESIELDTPTSL